MRLNGLIPVFDNFSEQWFQVRLDPLSVRTGPHTGNIRWRMNPALRQWLDTLGFEHKPDEFEVKALLHSLDIATPRGRRIFPEETFHPGTMSGPFVVKVCSPEIRHKSEIGGILCNIPETGLEPALETMRTRFPGLPLLVEEQLAFSGVELIAGALSDDQFGAVIMAGAGGVLAELSRDVAFRTAPCPEIETRRLLEELRIAPVFHGYRGLVQDVGQLARILSSIADLAVELADLLVSLDINPLVFTLEGWVALDAGLELRPADGTGRFAAPDFQPNLQRRLHP